MANYRNLFYTDFKGPSSGEKRIPVSQILTTAQLNGEKTRNYMVLNVLDASNKPTGAEIRIQPGKTISVP